MSLRDDPKRWAYAVGSGLVCALGAVVIWSGALRSATDGGLLDGAFFALFGVGFVAVGAATGYDALTGDRNWKTRRVLPTEVEGPVGSDPLMRLADRVRRTPNLGARVAGSGVALLALTVGGSLVGTGAWVGVVRRDALGGIVFLSIGGAVFAFGCYAGYAVLTDQVTWGGTGDHPPSAGGPPFR